MRKLLMVGLTGLLLFGASAAGSWFLLVGNAPEVASDDAPTAEPTEAPAHTEEVPRPFTPQGISPETIVRMTERISAREKSLKKRALLNEQQENRLKFIQDDIQREKKELESLQAAIAAELDRAGQLFEKINAQTEILKQATAAGEENAAVGTPPLNKAKIAEVATMLTQMPEDKATALIQGFVNDQDMDFVLQVVDSLEERDRAKILSTLDDAMLKMLLDRYSRFAAQNKGSAQR